MKNNVGRSGENGAERGAGGGTLPGAAAEERGRGYRRRAGLRAGLPLCKRGGTVSVAPHLQEAAAHGRGAALAFVWVFGAVRSAFQLDGEGGGHRQLWPRRGLRVPRGWQRVCVCVCGWHARPRELMVGSVR